MLNDAATVWPRSIVRLITTPSIGERITLLFRSARARSCCACASVRLAWATCISRLDWSSARPDRKFCATSCSLRSNVAWARRRLARADAIFASAWRTWALKMVGSSLRSTWPFLTRSLKSAFSSATVPDTCEPTLISATGLMVPVAVTVWLMAPRSTTVLRYWDGGTASSLRFTTATATATAARTATAMTTRFLVKMFIVCMPDKYQVKAEFDAPVQEWQCMAHWQA